MHVRVVAVAGESPTAVEMWEGGGLKEIRVLMGEAEDNKMTTCT